MSAAKKDSFLFESDDSDQQILPFDFLDEDDEDEDLPETVDMKAPDPKDKPAEVPASTAEKEELPEEAAEEKSETESQEEKTEITSKKETEEEIPKVSEFAKTDEIPTTEIEETTKEEAAPKKEKEKKQPDPSEMEKNVEEEKKIATPSGLKPGQILQEARVRKDLSIDQVSQNTKIKSNFIKALEEDDVANLPAAVYVEAYIKTLASLYGIGQKQVLEGISKTKPDGKIVPNELLSHIEEGKQVNFAEEAKVNKFFKIAAIIIIIIILGILLIVNFSGKKENTNPEEIASPNTENITPDPKITSEDLEVFIYPKPFTMTEMEMPAKNGVEGG